MASPTHPRILALFQKRIEGDDSLLRLAGLRFRQAGLGTEIYAGTPDELESLWAFRPEPEDLAIIHLDRGIDLLAPQSRGLIADFAHRFRGRVSGLVIHDQREMVSQRDAYFHAVQNVASQLERIHAGPRLFIEYAAGIEPCRFIEFFEFSRKLGCISACIDVGHVGIWQIWDCYSRNHPGEEVSGMAPDHPRIPDLVAKIQDAVHSSLPVVLGMIEALGRLAKPLHLHLHDGHPLSTLSRYGVSDHLSFLTRIPIPFEHDHKWSLDPMYGPSGLYQIISKSMEVVDPAAVSFTLEIHPAEGRLPLRDASSLFEHWKDKANAERMNYWLSVLLENHQLVLAARESRLASRPELTNPPPPNTGDR
jgi:hypothetical protein